MSSATVTRSPATPAAAVKPRRRLTAGRVVLYVFVTLTALAWPFPVVWAVLNSFRDYDYTSVHGYASPAGSHSKTRSTPGSRATSPAISSTR